MDALRPRISEKAFALGPRKSLVGVLTETSPAPDDGRPVLVILNAGVIHRVGPSRMNVLLARWLGAEGYASLRFDLSGLGDSEPRGDGLPLLDGVYADIREALDWLEGTRHIARVVLVGLCSGANHALGYAGQDRRVVGAVLLDPATPRTFKYYLHHFLPRMFRPRVWMNLLRGRHPLVRDLARRFGRGGAQSAGPPGVDLQSPEIRALLQQAWRRSLDQGVQFLSVFTSSLEDQYNYREQLLDAFPEIDFGPKLRLEYFEHCEHTFTAERDRTRLFRLVAEWLAATPFAAGGAAKPQDG